MNEGGRPGLLRRTFSRLATSPEDMEARELRKECLEYGATPVLELPNRKRVKVSGTLRTVTLRPVGGVPALEAELFDGSGVVTLVWLGRRRIAAIEPGRGIIASGLVTEQDGRRVIFNPRYELRAVGGE